ncbi:hypothetical protein MBRA1_003576 [Malassezia brasiliensis]|uniref:Uncharacterized protein n=1 Tax=Malassezia brasiliensis TaxID=1821822 RepID=A0AAF0E0K7_9BASI|nr:hypothetical protein MBRA1_003576 [Malassezia brasiliensis]
MTSAARTAAPLLQTPIQLAVHSHSAKDGLLTNLRSARACNTTRSHVALGDVVRVRGGGARRRRGLLACVEQGQAITLLDVATQTPVHTYTLAPADRACTPPLVVERRVGEAWVRTTYAAFADSDGASTLWALTEHLDAHGHAVPGAAEEKRTWRLAGAVEALFALPSGDLLAVRADAVVLLADPLCGDAREQGVLHGAFDVRYDTQLLLGADTPSLPEPTGAALVLVTGGEQGVGVHVVGVHADAPRLRAHTQPVDATPARDVTSAAWLPHATLAVLQRSGTLVTRRVRLGGEDAEAPAAVALAPLRGAAARLVGLSASHLLVLALPTGDARKERAAAFVWDVGLATVLAQAEWSLGATPTGPARISAAPASDTHVAVLVDVPHRDVVRSSVLALPVSVPDRGLLVHALHTAAQTAAWVAPRADDAPAVPLGEAHAALLAQLDALAPAERTAQLDTLFAAFLHGEEERLRAATHVKASRKAPKPALPTPFVQAVLRAALPAADKGAAQPVAPQTLRYLLERNVVSASMVPGDALVPRVRATHDWSTLYLVLRHVPDLAEAHAVAIVRAALAARADPAAPTVARVLQHVLSPPPFSKPALRMALRTHIVDNDDVLILLDIVRCWIDAAVHTPLAGAAGARAAEHVRTVPRTRITYRTSDVRAPSLDAVASFGEDVLDTFFPQLLADTSTHACLAECTRALTQSAGDLHTLARLSAPLDAFARAEATKGAAKTEAKSKRLALHEASLLVPLYSRESLDV